MQIPKSSIFIVCGSSLYGLAHLNQFLFFFYFNNQTNTEKAILVKISKILLICLMIPTFTGSLSCCLISEGYGWRCKGNKTKN